MLVFGKSSISLVELLYDSCLVYMQCVLTWLRILVQKPDTMNI